MNDAYFLEISNLHFEDLSLEGLKVVSPWIPRGKGVIARLNNHSHGAEQFDYVVITEDMIYFAIILSKDDGLTMRSIKYFKSCAVIAFAFITEAMPGESDEPQMRLMLSDGRRLKLCFDTSTDKTQLVMHMQELATKNFFMA